MSETGTQIPPMANVNILQVVQNVEALMKANQEVFGVCVALSRRIAALEVAAKKAGIEIVPFEQLEELAKAEKEAIDAVNAKDGDDDTPGEPDGKKKSA